MSEIEKMYKNAGIDYEERYNNCTLNKEGQCELKCSCDICKYSEEKYIFPLLTAEKQIELIKWVGKNMNGFNVFYDTSFNNAERHYWCCADQCYEDFIYACHKKDFSDALAGLINELPLSEEEKQQVKGILE